MAKLPDRGTPPPGVNPNLNILDADDEPCYDDEVRPIASSKPAETVRQPKPVHRYKLTLQTRDLDLNYKYSEMAETEIAYLFVVDVNEGPSVKIKTVLEGTLTADTLKGSGHPATYIGEPVLFSSVGLNLLILLKNPGE
jgi:hypothetical protein